ncbi:MAG: PIF1 family DEAD/DEAH box helicase [bacterium]|nr:PIF1 family DEAD/DEAH box helicase [bacterium]
MTQQEALTILKTGASAFLTGEPGSGKTHTIREYIRYLQSVKVSVAVTASTGIAATHLRGVTLHSWSGIGVKKYLSDYDVDRIASTERLARRIGQTHVLVIDEVSMLDAQVLTDVDRVCREVKRNAQPFGGIQVMFVGDFFQLPPVTKEGERPAHFAFTSPVWTQIQPLVCYLSEQHRQGDAVFLEILAALRTNTITSQHCAHLDRRCVGSRGAPEARMTQLFSHNVDVDHINNEELEKIPGKPIVFHMRATGQTSLVEQLKRSCLSPEQLALKEGAAVMFTKNSPQGAFVNGTLGTIVGFDQYSGHPIVETRSKRRIQTEPMDWTMEENGRPLARIAQIPLRLAWAMTIHKSQGMSLDAAFMDLRQVFVAGQGYVALSRVRSLDGLFLAGYTRQALAVHPDVLARDAEFRQQSAALREAFSNLSAETLRTMHQNFLRAVGGTPPTTEQHQRTDGSPASSVERIRTKHANAYRAWQEQEDAALTEQYQSGESVPTIAQRLDRQPSAIRSRLRKIGLTKDD